jgi:hypothetical protein
MYKVMQNNDIERELGRLIPVGLDSISGAGLMNRVEVKYLFNSAKLAGLLNQLADYYQVLEIRNMRILPYSTIYFDTADYLFYYQHLRGELERHKLRVRNYGATDESFLEIKRKTNKGRTIKWRIENNRDSVSFDQNASVFIRKFLPVDSELLRPVLVNRFNRITLAGIELKERITIDFNITFSSIDDNPAEIALPYLAVAEIKKDAWSDSTPFRSLIKQQYIYPSGFSKYCIGNALLNTNLKNNNIKPKILYLNKLEYEYS